MHARAGCGAQSNAGATNRCSSAVSASGLSPATSAVTARGARSTGRLRGRRRGQRVRWRTRRPPVTRSARWIRGRRAWCRRTTVRPGRPDLGHGHPDGRQHPRGAGESVHGRARTTVTIGGQPDGDLFADLRLAAGVPVDGGPRAVRGARQRLQAEGVIPVAVDQFGRPGVDPVGGCGAAIPGRRPASRAVTSLQQFYLVLRQNYTNVSTTPPLIRTSARDGVAGRLTRGSRPARGRR